MADVLDAAALDFDTDLVRSMSSERLASEAVSLPRDAATERSGWDGSDLDRVGARAASPSDAAAGT
ncbi:hypothetical protein [Streptomyces sp. NRRL S-1022]|uniref:hypothetical protein n=1 Tax=Streptomyces sp. NRRL S-1022 TaxID=1463880 RepID=UPI0004C201F1|nr:hypothetical protein [Streptomyces sp. NRRL S-1022]